MAGAFVQQCEGLLVGLEARPYSEFVDEKGETRPGGFTYRAYVSQSFETEPVLVKLRTGAEFDAVQAGADFGSTVRFMVKLVNGREGPVGVAQGLPHVDGKAMPAPVGKAA